MEQNRLERIHVNFYDFVYLATFLYCKENTCLNITVGDRQRSINWKQIDIIITNMILLKQFDDMPMGNLSEDFGNNQRKNYDSVGVYLKELFYRCEDYAKYFYVSRFKFFAGFVLYFVCFVFGIGYVLVNRDSKKLSWPYRIVFTLFELGSIACLVYSFAFNCSFFLNVSFAAIFLLRTLYYAVVLTVAMIEEYREMKKKEITKNIIDDFNKNKSSIRKAIELVNRIEQNPEVLDRLAITDRDGFLIKRQQSLVTNNVKSETSNVPLRAVAEGKVEII